MKHHYVPQFLLRRWTDASGKVRTYSVRDDRVTISDLGPRYTGYENRLYALAATIAGVGKDHLEKRLFGPIDSNAARALDKLERRVMLSEDDQIAWTFFLASLRMRQPDVLDFLRAEGRMHLAQTLAELDAATLPIGDPGSEAWFERNFPGAIDDTSLTSWLPRIIFNDEVMETFGDLNWWWREFEPHVPRLLLSDLPIHWEGGLRQGDFMIQLPIAPNRVFFGTQAESTEAILSAMEPEQLVERVNRTSLAATSRRIWGVPGDPQQDFITANLALIGQNVARFSSYAPWNVAKAD